MKGLIPVSIEYLHLGRVELIAQNWLSQVNIPPAELLATRLIADVVEVDLRAEGRLLAVKEIPGQQMMQHCSIHSI